MDYLFQKVSYLQGLADGLGVDDSTKEGKLLINIIETLQEFADALDELVDDHADLEDYMDCCDDEDCGCYCGDDEEHEE
jgi:hypothetical protein